MGCKLLLAERFTKPLSQITAGLKCVSSFSLHANKRWLFLPVTSLFNTVTFLSLLGLMVKYSPGIPSLSSFRLDGYWPGQSPRFVSGCFLGVVHLCAECLLQVKPFED